VSETEIARRRVTVLGSTGSVGTQAIDLITAYPDHFRATAICAAGSDVAALAMQAARLEVPVIGIADPAKAAELDLRCRESYPRHVAPPFIVTGGGAASELAALDTDVVLNAIDGAQALRPTMAALDAGRIVALANKESLIVGGALLTGRAHPGQIVPVDSEHSALAQCLRGGGDKEVDRLILTASGGPFRGRTRDELAGVTAQQALAHPTWNMGRVITTNSATLMNKGLELIEAHLLFGIGYDQIDTVIHPESYIHSMVQFIDGAVLAQLSPPDMRLPIALALNWPDRLPGAVTSVDWSTCHRWHFEPVDHQTFPAIALARTAGTASGCAPAVLNAANEHLVAAFHDGRIGFLDIIDRVGDTLYTWLHKHHGGESPADIQEINTAQTWARAHAEKLIR
jgi:1-deoxy-D-xylulose-5-phosphate reductoisomerase